MGEENEMPRTVKVVDRRRFTAEGDPRDEASFDAEAASGAVETAPEKSVGVEDGLEDTPRREAPEPPTTAVGSPHDHSPPTVETSPEFVELVVTLAQQAELLLVGAEGFPAKPDEARRMIDYLAALESKTAGNLSRDEKQILSNTVFQLRTMFVQSR